MSEAISPSRLQRTWHQVRALLLTAAGLLIIITALIVGLGRAMIPHADQLRPWLESQASERLGQNLRLERVEAEWPRLTPSLILRGLHLDDAAGNQLNVDQARLEVHLPNLLNRSRNVVRLVLLGLELVLEPDEDGRWGARLGGAGGNLEADWSQILPPGDLLIRDAMLRVRPRLWPEVALNLSEGSVQRRGELTQFQGSLVRPGGDEQLELRVQLEQADQAWRAVRGWLELRNLAPGAFAGSADAPDPRWPDAGARVDGQVWLDWSADTQVWDIDIQLSGRPEPAAAQLETVLRLQAEADALNMELAEIIHGEQHLASGLALGRRAEEDRVIWAIAVDSLELGGLHQALAPWLAGLDYWPLELSGQIQGLLLGSDQALSLHAASGSLRDLNIQMDEPLPSISDLDLKLDLDGDRLLARLGGGPSVRWRRHIRGDMAVDALSGDVLLAPASIELRSVAVESAEAKGSADGWVYLHRPRPFLDFQIDVKRVGPLDPRPYLSYRTIPEPAMDWLDEALVWVEHASGLVNLHLTAGTRARDLHPGSYQADADFEGARLNYWAGWPTADSIDGSVTFIGNSLIGQVDRARFAELELGSATLEIPELTDPVMSIAMQAEAAEGGDILALLQDIPIEGWQSVVSPLRWAGVVDAQVGLRLPFRDMSDWWIEGKVDFDHSLVGLTQPDLAVDAVSGSLAFDRAGIEPTVLEARLAEQDFELAVAAAFETPAFLELEADFDPSKLNLVSAALGPLAEQIQGAADWRFRLEGATSEADGGLEMSLESDLVGLAIDWPAPLGKAAATAWPSRASLSWSAAGQELAFTVSDLAVGRWLWLDGSWALSLAAGEEPLPDVPTQGARVRGQIDHLDLREWWAYANEFSIDGAQANLEFLDLALSLDQLDLPGVSSRNVELSLERAPDGWSAAIDSAELSGVVSVPLPLEAGRAIVADLRRLHLERAAQADSGEQPELNGLDDQVSSLNPRGLPPLSLAIEDLRWGDLVLGRARLEAHPMDSGLEVELLDVSGADLRLQGRGRWIDSEGGPESQFLGRMTSPSLSALVRAAGYEAGLEAARAQLDMDLRWPGAPQDFALRRLIGSLDVQLSDGEIPEARPGAGRLLGLASFTAIPRRLMLDFRDVFATGLRFDDVEGRLELNDGYASTDGLVLRSPAAVVTIRGQTDLAARRYDQQVTVEPGLGATLPVIGGLAGGPVGAAAGLVLRQILDRPLRGLAEVRYQVSGPWDAPEIELIAARLPDEADESNNAPKPPSP